MATSYDWNASLLDGTDIIRSVPAIGRTLRFPLNIGIADIPALVDNPSASVVSFLRYLQRDVLFARQLLAYLVEDHRLIHREQVNEKEYLVRYKPGDIAMAKVNVKIKRSISRVANLVYQSKWPFVVVKDAGFSAYIVRRYSKPNSALRKYMTEDLNIFPPAILPCEYLDTPDMQYLNSDLSRIKHIFDNTADIENYNISWFEDQPPSREPTFIQDIVIPSISYVRAKPLSDTYTCDEATSLWTDVSPSSLLPRPASPVPQPPSIVRPSLIRWLYLYLLVLLSPFQTHCYSPSQLQQIVFFSFSTPHRALCAHVCALSKYNLIRAILLLPRDSISVRFFCATLAMLANLPTSLTGGLSGEKLNRMRTKRSNLVLVSSLLLVLTLMHLSLLNLG